VNNEDKNKFTWKTERIDISEYGFDENTEREMIEDLSRAINKEIINKVIEMGNDIIKVEKIDNSLESKIAYYDKKYHDNKHSYFFKHMAENGLINSIYFRTKKILRDYCE
jgi:hypothetical protein